MLVKQTETAHPDDAMSPLEASLGRLGAGDVDTRYVAGVPAEVGWVLLADAIADDSHFDRWFEAARANAAGSDAVGASFLASWLAGVIVGPVTRAIIRERRAWSVAAGDLLVHPHPDGWFDGMAVRVPKVRMLPGDPDSKHGDAVVVDDLAVLRGSVAGELAATLAMIFGAIRRRARLGQPAMWGGVADGAAFAAVSDAVAQGADPEAALVEAMSLVEAIAARAPLPRVRPSLARIEWSGGVAHETVRGTCCLWYRTQVDPDPSGEGYCDSCPRRDPEDRRRRWALMRDAEGEPRS